MGTSRARGQVKVLISEQGLTIHLSGAESRVLVEELGDMPGRGKIKVRQLHDQLSDMLRYAGTKSIGHDGLERDRTELAKSRIRLIPSEG